MEEFKTVEEYIEYLKGLTTSAVLEHEAIHCTLAKEKKWDINTLKDFLEEAKIDDQESKKLKQEEEEKERAKQAKDEAAKRLEGLKEENDPVKIKETLEAIGKIPSSIIGKIKAVASQTEKNKYIQEHTAKVASLFDSFFIERKAIETGLTELDKFLDGGLHAGLYVLGAESGAGKTTFALQIADNIAKTKQDVLFFSGEMTDREMLAKSLSRMSKETAEGNNRNALTMRTILNVKATNNSDYEEKINKHLKANYISECRDHIWIYDGLQEINDIEDKIEEHKRITGNTPVVFIDYLQIIKNDNLLIRDRRLQIDEIVGRLRIAATKKYETPIFVIGSLNRDAYRKDKNNSKEVEKNTSMGDLKESGGIEYGVDVKLRLETSEDEDDGNERVVEVQIQKNRTGKRHKKEEVIKFKFHTMFNYFEDDGVLIGNKRANSNTSQGKNKKGQVAGSNPRLLTKENHLDD
jgi:replicative DNA helicase